jgi:hypothetical protein
VLAEILIGFASLGKGAIGMVNTTSDLFLLLKTLSFMKNAKSLMEKLRDVIPKSSVTIRPRETMEVFNAFMSDPLMWTKPTGIIGLFGGKTLNMLITDEDLKNSVMFNTELDKDYTVDKTGVSPYLWNGGFVKTGLRSSAPPSLTRISDNEMVMAYRDIDGNRIFMCEFKEGRFTGKPLDTIKHDTEQGVGVTVMRNNLCIVARHQGGEQMYALWEKNHQFPSNSSKRWLGIDIDGKPSATTVGNKTYIAVKNLGTNLLWATLDSDGRTEKGYVGMDSIYAPSIHAFKGKFYMFFARMDTRQICVAVSDDGKKWKETRNNLPRTSAGVTTTIYKDKLYILYRDGDGNGVFYMWTEDGKTFKHAPNIYFGFDVENEPTASPLPGDDNGIMVAGLLPVKWSITDPLSFPTTDVVIWTIFMPWESNKKGVKIIRGSTVSNIKTAGAAVKTKEKKRAKVVTKKPAAKSTKVVSPVKAKTTTPKKTVPTKRKAVVSKPVVNKVVAKKKATAATVVKTKNTQRKVAAPVKRKAAVKKKVAVKAPKPKAALPAKKKATVKKPGAKKGIAQKKTAAKKKR